MVGDGDEDVDRDGNEDEDFSSTIPCLSFSVSFSCCLRMAVRRRAAAWRDGRERKRRPVGLGSARTALAVWAGSAVDRSGRWRGRPEATMVGDGDEDVDRNGGGDEDGDGEEEDRVHGPVPLRARMAVGQGRPWAGTAASGTTGGATTAGAVNGDGRVPGRVRPRA